MEKEKEKENKFKSGFVSIVGRTNVGKSTLLNMLVGEKIAATANKVQTTRYAIKGILNSDNYQIIFTDTPGVHKPKTKLSQAMVDTAFTMLPDCDVLLFLVDATSDEIWRGDQLILDKIKEKNTKTILIINKVDLVKREKLLNLIKLFSEQYNFEAVIPISANNEKYKGALIDEITKILPEGPLYYDKDEYTDQTLRQIAEETLREKALICLSDEVPHGLFVECDEFKTRKNKNGEDVTNISLTIYCLRDSQKAIIIGKGGKMLKRIGTMTRYELEKILGQKVNLKTWVKVKPDWNETESFVKKFKLNK